MVTIDSLLPALDSGLGSGLGSGATSGQASGLDDASIVDVINAASFFNWANRLMLSLGEPAATGG